ncbi:MAG: MFS transporter [Victivallaceae bacterium]|nr:MFS transporter [Victivallaceae bacterium]
MMKKRSFIPLFTTNFFGVVNDNFLKTLAMFIVCSWIDDEKRKSVFMGTAAGALVLPYILCSPLADRLMQKIGKLTTLRAAKYAELPIMALAIAGFCLHSAALIVFSVFLMGLQSSLYSPAKYALVRDVGGIERLSTGLGWMDGLSFLGMLSGTVFASFLVDHASPSIHYGCLILFAVLGLAASYTVSAQEERLDRKNPLDPFSFLFAVHARTKKIRDLDLIILFSGIFWWTAATMQMGLLLYGVEILGLSSFQTGIILAGAAVGITTGNVAAGIVARNHYLIGAVPATGMLAAALLFLLGCGNLPPAVFGAALTLFSFALGFFKLPFDVEIQKLVKGPELNTVLAYVNQVTFLFMLVASGTYALGGMIRGASAFLPMAGCVLAAASVYFLFAHSGSFCATGRFLLHRRYHVTVTGMDALREGCSHLVMPNHIALIDPVLIRGEFYRTQLRPLVDEAFFHGDILSAHVLAMMDAVRVPDMSQHLKKADAAKVKALDSIVIDTLGKGDNILLYPSGHISTDGTESIGNRQLGYNVCRELPDNARVLLIRTTGLWGSMWSRKGKKRSPDFGKTLLKALALWVFYTLTFHRRREVLIEIEDHTDDVKAWSALPRREFNRKLEEWYNRASEIQP